MAHGPKVCACCGAADGIESHHLYSQSDGCPADLTVWLCYVCHARAHELRNPINHRQRTRAALAAKKAQGALLGNRTNIAEARRAAVDSNRRISAAFAANVLPIIQQIQASGVTSYTAIAAALNARGIHSARGGTWGDTAVRNILRRSVGGSEAAQAQEESAA